MLTQMETSGTMAMWQRRDDWVGTQVEDHFVMIHLESGRYVALNDTAAEAWRALEEPRDDAALAGALMAKFDVDAATCEQSVPALLDRMRALDLINEVG